MVPKRSLEKVFWVSFNRVLYQNCFYEMSNYLFFSKVNSMANRRHFGETFGETAKISQVGTTIQEPLFAFLRTCACIHIKIIHLSSGYIQCHIDKSTSLSIHTHSLHHTLCSDCFTCLLLVFHVSMTLFVKLFTVFELCVLT